MTQLQLQCDVNSDQIELGLSLEGQRSDSTTQRFVLGAVILRLSDILVCDAAVRILEQLVCI